MNRINLSLLIPVILLILISLSTFYSIDLLIFKQQLFFVIFSFFLYILFLFIDYKIIIFYSQKLYYIMVALLLILFFIGIEARGAVRWIDVFGARIQFSEIFKPFIIIFFAQYILRDQSKSLVKFVKTILLMLPIFFLTLKQPDLGNATIYILTLLFMLFMYGFPIKYFLSLFLMILLPFPFLFQFLHDYQKSRIISFFNFSYDPLGSSYNAIQSVIAVGSGGIFGKGLGQATQSILKFLPERHTDFIFASIAESLGLVGAIFLLILYAFLLYKIIRIASATQDEFSKLALNGFFFLFLTHIFFNIGMNIGIFPVVGITLPFVSYGGSSLLSNFIMLGLISSIGFESKSNVFWK